MRDRGYILAGLLVFLSAITFPIWYNLAGGKTSKGPEPKLPAQEKFCVAPVSYMKTSHMELLMQWRDQAVRQDIRNFRAYDGRNYTISLTGTCLMKCHTNKAEFCDRCHNYAGANPYCWDCHVDPNKLVLRSAR